MPSLNTPAQQFNALMSHYLKLYRDKYGQVPPGWNRNTARWVFRDMRDDYGYEESKRIIEYFFGCEVRLHPINRLADLYGAMYQNMIDEERDAKARMELRKQTEERVRGD